MTDPTPSKLGEAEKQKVDLICLLAFEAGKTYENRYRLFFPDDLGECLSMAFSRGGMFPKETFLTEKMFNVLPNSKYSKEIIISSLSEPWKTVEEAKNILFTLPSNDKQ